MLVSVVMPIYNEANLLPLSLENLTDVDEIICVDGSPNGLSTDNSKFIIEQHGAKYIPYESNKGYSRQLQLQLGYKEVQNDFVMIISADMLISNLKTIIDSDMDIDQIWCYQLEFWLNKENIRITDKAFHPICLIQHRDDVDKMKVSYHKEIRQIYYPHVFRYHLGWIRDFKSQVEKHISHIKLGLWSELGKEIMTHGDQGIEAWAIHHVLKYRTSSYARCHFNDPIIEKIPAMTYRDGFDIYKEDFEKRYTTEFYTGIMNFIPTSLLA